MIPKLFRKDYESFIVQLNHYPTRFYSLTKKFDRQKRCEICISFGKISLISSSNALRGFEAGPSPRDSLKTIAGGLKIKLGEGEL